MSYNSSLIGDTLYMNRSSLYKRRKRNDSLSQPVAASTTSTVRRLMLWHELPEWRRDNEYMLSGYRQQTDSVLGCIHSIYAYAHNETVNIHSHLWAALLFLLFLSTLSARLAVYPTTGIMDAIGFSCFLLSAVLCLSFSAIFHSVMCHSENVKMLWNKMDYAGIAVFIVGTQIPNLFYTFYCDPHLQVIYILQMLIAGVGTMYIVLSPHYEGPAYRGLRVLVFIALAFSALVSTGHALYMMGFRILNKDLGYNWLVAGGVCYILGGTIYAKRFPERWWPGRFDTWGTSHQIFHVNVVVAALLHWKAIQTGAHFRHGVMEGTCPPS